MRMIELRMDAFEFDEEMTRGRNKGLRVSEGMRLDSVRGAKRAKAGKDRRSLNKWVDVAKHV